MRPRLPIRCGLFAAGLLLALHPLAAAPARALPPPPPAATRYAPAAVQAAYLLNFLRFTEWPPAASPAAGEPLVIGVANHRELEEALLGLVEKLVIRNHRVRIVRLKTPRDLEACHLAYFEGVPDRPADFLPPLAEALAALRDRPVLTVSNLPAFLAEGGMVRLFIEGDNLRFAIDPARASAASIVFSSRLLALARTPPTPPAVPSP